MVPVAIVKLTTREPTHFLTNKSFVHKGPREYSSTENSIHRTNPVTTDSANSCAKSLVLMVLAPYRSDTRVEIPLVST